MRADSAYDDSMMRPMAAAIKCVVGCCRVGAPFQPLQLRADLLDERNFPAGLAAWEAWASQRLADFDALSRREVENEGMVEEEAAHMFKFCSFEELCAVEIFGESQACRIRGLPFGRPVSDWL